MGECLQAQGRAGRQKLDDVVDLPVRCANSNDPNVFEVICVFDLGL